MLFSVPMFFQAQDHSKYTALLSDYVIDGRVNYAEMRNDSRLEEYLNTMRNINPDTISSRENQLAYWINIYNAYTLKVICENYPVESINDLHTGGLIIGTVFSSTIWDEDFVIVNSNRRLTLNDVEHEIIRPKYKDARAHFALVCASKSCPPLRSEAYTGEKLDDQLDHQGRVFMNDRTKNYLDFNRKTAYISKIFDWFEEDFGDDDEEVMKFIWKYFDNIPNNTSFDPSEWDIDYLDYDWSLNE